ncbi:kunitz type trypsin inhibitor 104 [Humulus lupulus]|uniref:kunitz type trypsin inhibitor 104 n=1 Tax=Humulus lupulus TaxID=3486 RepID=UPI002B401833|nr:kunitz type trypsin inhibitor 104 [Humulus lupulus]
MMMKLVLSSLTASLIWLFLTATPATAQTPILDTNGQPLRRGVEYHIKPATTDNGGAFTLVDRNGSCPWYAGQENATSSSGIPVTFSPFLKAENVVMESMSFEVAFAIRPGATTCPDTKTNWKVSTMDTHTSGAQARLIETGGNGTVLHYFQVYLGSEVEKNGSYGLRWCPAEVCPYCRIDCGFVDVLVENGKRLLALNETSAFPVVFERA